MAVLVVLLGVVVALLAVLVAGLLRSHAEILRALHQLGVDLDPARDADASVPVAGPTVRSNEVPNRPSRHATDVVGTAPDQSAVTIAVTGRDDLSLIAFLSSGCGSCHFFWDAFAEPKLQIPGDARLVVVTKGAEAEQPAMVRKLAPAAVPVVMSSAAWDDYDVPVAPFFVLVEGATGVVIGEGAANTWEQVTALLQNALGDAGMLDRAGRRKAGARSQPRAEAEREARVDHDLLAAGILPGDPSLYQLPDRELPDR
jgi:hypothetical protein